MALWRYGVPLLCVVSRFRYFLFSVLLCFHVSVCWCFCVSVSVVFLCFLSFCVLCFCASVIPCFYVFGVSVFPCLCVCGVSVLMFFFACSAFSMFLFVRILRFGDSARAHANVCVCVCLRVCAIRMLTSCSESLMLRMTHQGVSHAQICTVTAFRLSSRAF